MAFSFLSRLRFLRARLERRFLESCTLIGSEGGEDAGGEVKEGEDRPSEKLREEVAIKFRISTKNTTLKSVAPMTKEEASDEEGGNKSTVFGSELR